VPGASPADLIRRHAGHESVWPPTAPLWRHSAGWWTQWPRFAAACAGLPSAAALDRYVALTQADQARHLAAAAAAAKARFPRCGGFLVWMGHDCFPCPANTSLFDFARRPKPAARALAAVFRHRS
jgi:beta-mannosidase